MTSDGRSGIPRGAGGRYERRAAIVADDPDDRCECGVLLSEHPELPKPGPLRSWHATRNAQPRRGSRIRPSPAPGDRQGIQPGWPASQFIRSVPLVGGVAGISPLGSRSDRGEGRVPVASVPPQPTAHRAGIGR
jgi:hypothetical protein